MRLRLERMIERLRLAQERNTADVDVKLRRQIGLI